MKEKGRIILIELANKLFGVEQNEKTKRNLNDEETELVVTDGWNKFLNKLYFEEMSEMFYQKDNGKKIKPLFKNKFRYVIGGFEEIVAKYKDSPLLPDSIDCMKKLYFFYYGNEDIRTKNFLEKYVV